MNVFLQKSIQFISESERFFAKVYTYSIRLLTFVSESCRYFKSCEIIRNSSHYYNGTNMIEYKESLKERMKCFITSQKNVEVKKYLLI